MARGWRTYNSMVSFNFRITRSKGLRSIDGNLFGNTVLLFDSSRFRTVHIAKFARRKSTVVRLDLDGGAAHGHSSSFDASKQWNVGTVESTSLETATTGVKRRIARAYVGFRATLRTRQVKFFGTKNEESVDERRRWNLTKSGNAMNLEADAR